MLFSLKNTVFRVFSCIIQNTIVSVWYYHMPFSGNVETQGSRKGQFWADVSLYQMGKPGDLHKKHSCHTKVLTFLNFTIAQISFVPSIIYAKYVKLTRCQVSGVTCHMSHVTCHMSQTLRATVKDLASANSSSMHSRM